MNNVNSCGEFLSRLMQVGGASCVFLSFGHCFYTPNKTANGQHSNISAAWRLRTCYAILKQLIKVAPNKWPFSRGKDFLFV